MDVKDYQERLTSNGELDLNQKYKEIKYKFGNINEKKGRDKIFYSKLIIIMVSSKANLIMHQLLMRTML